MKIITLIIAILISLLMLWQDVKYRGISWYLFPFMGINMLLYRYLELGGNWRQLGLDWLFSLLFLGLILAVMFLYFATKKIPAREVLSRYMALGDLLFFAILSLALPLPFFGIFFIASLLFALMLGLTVFRGKTVPLAGLQALLLALTLVSEQMELLAIHPLNLVL